MPQLDYAFGAADVKELLPAGAYTTTGGATGTGISTLNYQGAMLITLDTALGTGTTPTLDTTLETSADNSTGWTAIGAAFTQVTGAAGAGVQSQIIQAGDSKGYIRVKGTIAGTTPSFAACVTLAALKHY